MLEGGVEGGGKRSEEERQKGRGGGRGENGCCQSLIQSTCRLMGATNSSCCRIILTKKATIYCVLIVWKPQAKSLHPSSHLILTSTHEVYSVTTSIFWKIKLMQQEGDLQDGRGVRCGDQPPPHKYIKNTPTCGTTPTERLLNTGRRPQTSQKEQKPEGDLHTEVGPNPKLNPRSCVNKEEKGKFLHAA